MRDRKKRQLADPWHGKPYYSLDAYCKNYFHRKCYKVALNAHMTCPNRDGTLGTRGCVFCSAGGSGDFAVALGASPTGREYLPDEKGIAGQLNEGLRLFHNKFVSNASGSRGEPDLIAYFQAYTNTYAPLPYLEQVYREALDCPAVCGISIATRPDCLPDGVLRLLTGLKDAYPEKFIWVELGLQTIHGKTAESIRRGYALPCFEEAFHKLQKLDIPVIVHLILGLPGETADMMLDSVKYLNSIHPFGVKLQLLHILAGTDLADIYRENPFPIMEKEQYLTLIVNCLGLLSPGIVIHRLTGDGAKKDLIAPLWSTDKRDVLNSLHRMMREQGRTQGDRLNRPTQNSGGTAAKSTTPPQATGHQACNAAQQRGM